MSQINETRVNRNRKKNRSPWLLILILCLVVCGGGYVIYQSVFNQTTPNTTVVQNNTTAATNATVSTTTQTSQSTTQQKKYELVVENGIAKVGDIIIVNKRYGLPKDYNPGVNPVAEAQFMKMKEKMQSLGLNVGDEYSGFRSYELQEYFYNNYVSVVGVERANLDLAKPGFSEHQTGFAFDFKDKAGNLLGEVPGAESAVEYIKEHAHEYGFIVRYMKGKEEVTGYMAETWHIRYIGDLAKEVYESGLTLEEFFGIEGGGYGE